MQAHWINKDGNRGIIIFMLGWASHHSLIENHIPKGYDAVCIYDYRDIADYIEGNNYFLQDNDIRPENYAESYLFAWSFGVWASEIFFSDTEFDKAVAINGTPFPVHDSYGIPPRIMDITISGLSNKGLELFDRKTYGEHCGEYTEKHYPGTAGDYTAELEILNEYARMPYNPAIKWDKAIISINDKIFPVENMKCYWNGLAELLPLYHFPFIDGKLISNHLG